MTKRKAAVFLWFDTETEQAARFYAETFPDSASKPSPTCPRVCRAFRRVACRWSR